MRSNWNPTNGRAFDTAKSRLWGEVFETYYTRTALLASPREVLWQVVPESNTKVSASGNANPANAVQEGECR
ncbi:MAG UNVERIFIED_CONTAM: hypothetical protein LVR29_06685 [Microcystis novacekii LVE1205-3]